MASTARRECKRCGQQRPLHWFVSTKGTVCKACKKASTQAAHRKQRLAVYAITPHEYELLLVEQNGACGACHQPRRYNLHVEHDHRVERERGTRESIRGLACARCNSVLRKVRDDPEVLRGLIEFLENPPARRVL